MGSRTPLLALETAVKSPFEVVVISLRVVVRRMEPIAGLCTLKQHALSCLWVNRRADCQFRSQISSPLSILPVADQPYIT